MLSLPSWSARALGISFEMLRCSARTDLVHFSDEHIDDGRNGQDQSHASREFRG